MNKLYSIVRRNNGTIIWSKDQIQYIINDYNSNYSTTTLAKKFNTSPEAIRNLLRKNDVKILNLSQLKQLDYPRDSNYFEKIDSKDKAYWLGFLYADGYISQSNEIRINLTKKDEEHLQKFYDAIKATNHSIKYSQKVVKGKTYHTAYCNIRDKKMVEDLVKLGCVNNKSLILTFPTERQVPMLYLSHFIRGYFDGDGSIHYTQSGKAKTPNYRINFLGTKDMLLNIRKYFNKEKISLEKRGKIYSFSINGNRQIESVLEKIYENSTEEIELNRKKTIYNNYLLQRIDGEPRNLGCE